MRSPCTAMKSSPCSPQLEKAHAEQQRPNTAKRNKNLRGEKKKHEGESMQVGLCKGCPGQCTRILLPTSRRKNPIHTGKQSQVNYTGANQDSEKLALPSYFSVHFRSDCVSGVVMCDTKIKSVLHLPFLL